MRLCSIAQVAQRVLVLRVHGIKRVILRYVYYRARLLRRRGNRPPEPINRNVSSPGHIERIRRAGIGWGGGETVCCVGLGHPSHVEVNPVAQCRDQGPHNAVLVSVFSNHNMPQRYPRTKCRGTFGLKVERQTKAKFSQRSVGQAHLRVDSRWTCSIFGQQPSRKRAGTRLER